MIFEQIAVGGDRNFAYLVGDPESREAALVDPAHDPEGVVQRARALGLNVTWVLNTHGHSDHTGGNDIAIGLTGARLAAYGRGDVPLRDGDALPLGSLRIQTLHTPGHTPDSVCFLVAGQLITGDTLFVGKIGGTSTEEEARAEYDSLHGKIKPLPPETVIWPGHDYGIRPSSTVAEEWMGNPFLLQPDFAAFLDLKRNWAEYKRTHGIK